MYFFKSPHIREQKCTSKELDKRCLVPLDKRAERTKTVHKKHFIHIYFHILFNNNYVLCMCVYTQNMHLHTNACVYVCVCNYGIMIPFRTIILCKAISSCNTSCLISRITYANYVSTILHQSNIIERVSVFNVYNLLISHSTMNSVYL